MRKKRGYWSVEFSDTQVPFHHPKMIAHLKNWLEDNAEVIGIAGHVGDEIDLPQPSRWSKGNAGEHAGNLMRDIEDTRKVMTDLFGSLRPDIPKHMSRSNHGDRIASYVQNFAPALADFIVPGGRLDLAELIGYEAMGVEYHREPFEYLPGVVMCHGDEGGLRAGSGATAFGLAKRWNTSVICGHTHRQGLVFEQQGIRGTGQLIWGKEVGHTMDMEQADYLGPARAANWQSGFGVTAVEFFGNGDIHYTPMVRPLTDRGVGGGDLPAL